MRHLINSVQSRKRQNFLVECVKLTESSVSKSRREVLKDGTTIIITITPNDEYEAGKVFNVDALTEEGEYVGGASFGKNEVSEWDTLGADSWSSMTTHINQKFRRKGAASALYDTFTKAGHKIVRSGRYGGKLSPDGAALWDSRVEWKTKKGCLPHPVHPNHWKPKKKPVKEGKIGEYQSRNGEVTCVFEVRSRRELNTVLNKAGMWGLRALLTDTLVAWNALHATHGEIEQSLGEQGIRIDIDNRDGIRVGYNWHDCADPVDIKNTKIFQILFTPEELNTMEFVSNDC